MSSRRAPVVFIAGSVLRFHHNYVSAAVAYRLWGPGGMRRQRCGPGGFEGSLEDVGKGRARHGLRRRLTAMSDINGAS